MATNRPDEVGQTTIVPPYHLAPMGVTVGPPVAETTVFSIPIPEIPRLFACKRLVLSCCVCVCVFFCAGFFT